jgi:serine phosphatase RsbU (regulator of sigma subunit)
MRNRLLDFTRIISAGMLIILFAPEFQTAAQPFDNESRAIYIMDIARYVQWSNLAGVSVFTIGVLEPVPDLHPELRVIAGERATVQGRPVEVVHFNGINDLVPVNLLYLNRLNGYDISLVLGRTRGWNTLIISENYEFHRSMINFIVKDGKKSFEINEERMNQEGLFVNELFRAHAVPTETDWHEIYDQVEMELAREKMTVLEKTMVIDDLTEQISERQLQIIRQNEDINHQNDLLRILADDVHATKNELDMLSARLISQSGEIEYQTAEINSNRFEMARQDSILNIRQILISNQENLITGQDLILGNQLEQIGKQRLTIMFFIIMLVFAVILVYIIYKNYRIKREANINLEEKNRLITLQRDQIVAQNKLIWDSIHYAKRIQQAILPGHENFGKVLDHFFVFYRPKDVVSGDFYWESDTGHEIIIVAADCTGHGVPGALMSMLGVTFLNDIVNNRKITRPSCILDQLRDAVINAFNQRGRREEIRDGMDIAVCNIDINSKIIQFAGANNPLVIVRDGAIFHYKGDRMPVAIGDNLVSFNNHVIGLEKNDQIYVFSDGYIDQFGGKNNRKFMRRRLFDMLLEIREEPMQTQKEILSRRFDQWKGDHEQTDDVVMIGLKI